MFKIKIIHTIIGLLMVTIIIVGSVFLAEYFTKLRIYQGDYNV